VGERYWPVFFDKLRDCLKPGGRAALQVITIEDRYFEDYRRSMDFIQKYIFPGGMLPSPDALRRQVQAAGLSWLADHGFARDYAETLVRWRDRFLAGWPGIRELGFDERFRRMWEFYLAYCAGGFRAGTIDVKQIAVARS
jgi:cyclopropane-fatty-acyl-phospholipid synthase